MAHPRSLHGPARQSPRLLSSLLLSLSLLAGGAAGAQPLPPQPLPPQPPAKAPPAVAPPTPGGHMIAEIQVIPRPVGTVDDRYKHVDAAIAVIQASGLRYEVHALGTVVEGPSEKVWALLREIHEATLEAGAERTLSIIKVSSAARAGGPRVEDLVRKFRP